MDSKALLRTVLAGAMVGESLLEVGHDPAAIQPHIEPEMETANPSAHVLSNSIGPRGDSQPGGILRQKILYTKTARARVSTREMAMEDAYIEAATPKCAVE